MGIENTYVCPNIVTVNPLQWCLVMQQYAPSEIGTGLLGGHFSIKMLSCYPYSNFHYIYKVSWMSYLYNGNPITGKMAFILKQVSMRFPSWIRSVSCKYAHGFVLPCFVLIISPVPKDRGMLWFYVKAARRPPPAARHPAPAARNGVNAITQKPLDGLFSNLIYTLVVIVSWPD